MSLLSTYDSTFNIKKALKEAFGSVEPAVDFTFLKSSDTSWAGSPAWDNFHDASSNK